MSISDVGAAEKWIREACEILGLQSNVKVVAVVNKWRWTLDYEQDPLKPNFGMHMIRLERLLQWKTGRPIDLRLESEIDKNRRQQRNVLWTKTPSQLTSLRDSSSTEPKSDGTKTE